MNRRSVWIVFVGVMWLGWGMASGLDVGSPAPAFRLTSGDGQELTLDQAPGKVVVLLYETRDTVEQNRPFKNELSLFVAQSASVKTGTVFLSVINCSSAVWPVTKIWQARLRENSEKEHLTIYGDWDGKMAAAYGMKDNDSNVIIIDPKGVVRYRRAGKLKSDEISPVLSLLKQLVSS